MLFKVHSDTTSSRVELYDFVIGDISQSYDFRDTITEIHDRTSIHTIRREVDRVDLDFEFFDEGLREIDSRVGHKIIDN